MVGGGGAAPDCGATINSRPRKTMKETVPTSTSSAIGSSCANRTSWLLGRERREDKEITISWRRALTTAKS